MKYHLCEFLSFANIFKITGFAKQLLEVSDNLKRGVAAATTGEEISKERFDSLVEGRLIGDIRVWGTVFKRYFSFFFLLLLLFFSPLPW
tara:strand:- start:398 stop:664 length:267 start_codon:yes stop_codon:yes gene_type:complete